MDKKEEEMTSFARHMVFFDEDHIRVHSPDRIDCIISWRDMKVVAFHKSFNYSDTFFKGNNHPLLDKIPDEKSTNALGASLNNISHQIAMMVEIE